VLRDTRRGPEAEELYRRALGIRTAAPGAGNEALIETLRDYAVLLRRSGREREAAELEGRASRLSESKR
jgi:hypothetical protein